MDKQVRCAGLDLNPVLELDLYNEAGQMVA